MRRTRLLPVLPLLPLLFLLLLSTQSTPANSLPLLVSLAATALKLSLQAQLTSRLADLFFRSLDDANACISTIRPQTPSELALCLPHPVLHAATEDLTVHAKRLSKYAAALKAELAALAQSAPPVVREYLPTANSVSEAAEEISSRVNRVAAAAAALTLDPASPAADRVNDAVQGISARLDDLRQHRRDGAQRFKELLSTVRNGASHIVRVVAQVLKRAMPGMDDIALTADRIADRVSHAWSIGRDTVERVMPERDNVAEIVDQFMEGVASAWSLGRDSVKRVLLEKPVVAEAAQQMKEHAEWAWTCGRGAIENVLPERQDVAEAAEQLKGHAARAWTFGRDAVEKVLPESEEDVEAAIQKVKDGIARAFAAGVQSVPSGKRVAAEAGKLFAWAGEALQNLGEVQSAPE